MPGKKRAKGAKLSKAQLLAREKRIIADIKAGKLSYRQIAAKHGVSLPTVNNKARKAGISRGRRKGAKILVMGPRRKKAAKAGAVRRGRKPGRRAARKTVRRAARKVARRKVRRAVPMVSDLPVAAKKRRRVRRGRRRARAAVGRPAAKGKFFDAMRELVLRYHPNISLRSYDRLVKAVQAIA